MDFENKQQCINLEASKHWREDPSANGAITAHGATLTTAFDVLTQGEQRAADANVVGEEVVAIMAGEFDIDAAGEQYRLAEGEAILIPPGAARSFTCLSSRGVLYRAGTALSAASQDTRAV